jgi:hypothetical protein
LLDEVMPNPNSEQLKAEKDRKRTNRSFANPNHTVVHSYNHTLLPVVKMMLPEEASSCAGDAVFSDVFFDTLMEEVAGGAPTLPCATAILANPRRTAQELLQPPQAKHPLLVEDEDVAIQPPFTPPVLCSTHQFRRIPCKARGMSKKHNSDTAFLDVPADAPHGLLLSCSLPECGESGRKFRYCSICASPVAQRNFPKRHGHGLIESARDLLAVDYTSSFKEISVFEDASGYPCIEQTVAAPTLAKPHHRRVVSFDAARLPSRAPPASQLPFTTSCYPLSEQRVAPASTSKDPRHRRGMSFDAARLASQATPVVPFATSCFPLMEHQAVAAPPASNKENPRHRRGVSFDATMVTGQEALPAAKLPFSTSCYPLMENKTATKPSSKKPPRRRGTSFDTGTFASRAAPVVQQQPPTTSCYPLSEQRVSSPTTTSNKKPHHHRRGISFDAATFARQAAPAAQQQSPATSCYSLTEQPAAAAAAPTRQHRRGMTYDATTFDSQVAPLVPRAFTTSCYPLTEQRVGSPPTTSNNKFRHRRGMSYDATTFASQVAPLVQRPDTTAPATDSTLNLSAKEQQWLALLHKPTVVKPPVATRPATDSLLNLSAKEHQWLALLHKRPDLEQGLDMTQWMKKIISFSEKERSSTVPKNVYVAPGVEQPSFAPGEFLAQWRDTIVTPPPRPKPVTIEDERASSPVAYDSSSSARSILSFEGSMSLLDEPHLVDPSASNDQFQLIEAPVVLDDVEMTNFFD